MHRFRRQCRYALITVVTSFWVLSYQRVDVAAVKRSSEESDMPKTSVVGRVDLVEDSLYDSLAPDPSCDTSAREDCFAPPLTTIETEAILHATCVQGETLCSESDEDTFARKEENQCLPREGIVDKHWGSDPTILKMRNQLRTQAQEALTDSRPPIFLMPGLASTRLIAWKLKKCKGMFGGEIKVQDSVWLNINLLIQMGTIDVDCMAECLRLGLNQSDTDDWSVGCKLRPDEGLDAIASLAPGGIGSSLLVGGTNTVYAWLIQWLADNLGYDVTNIIGLPYDWRLSPDKMEARDGFLSMTRRRIEAAVASNGQPGIMVAHSMGNLVFRYFLEWLRVQLRKEAYDEYISRARRRTQSLKMAEQRLQQQQNWKSSPLKQPPIAGPEVYAQVSFLPGWLSGVVSGIDEWYEWLTAQNDTSTSDEVVQEETFENNDARNSNNDDARNSKLWELAVVEGDAKLLEWLEKHIWTYVGLSAPMLGVVNGLRAVISGENMGLPISDETARHMGVTFGSTHTLNPVAVSTGFCGKNQTAGNSPGPTSPRTQAVSDINNAQLACLEEIAADIIENSMSNDPWENFPALKAFLHDRIEWNSTRPMVDIQVELCSKQSGKRRCVDNDRLKLGAEDIVSGHLYKVFNSLWREQGEPMLVKGKQLEDSFLNTNVPNILNHTWERPLIKHIIMAYGVDIPTEVGYIYRKSVQLGTDGVDTTALPMEEVTGLPNLREVLWEEANGKIVVETIDSARGSLAEHFIGKKVKKEPYISDKGRLAHSGDGSVPYLSLSWAHTWLLHAARARRFRDLSIQNDNKTENESALHSISVSHRPHGAIDWVDGPPAREVEILDPAKLVDTADTGVDHPHGTRYKPLMVRYHNVGTSRKTGIDYSTTVIEAIGVEHKETTRNYDILAAVFTDILKYMHDDLGLVSD